MSTGLDFNWMRQLTAGNKDAVPSISSSLYNDISHIPIVEAIECVLSGGVLKKWRRGQPITPKQNPHEGNSKTKDASNAKEYVMTFSGRPHERYFWVSYICGTYFLRWQSRRKRSNETAFALCQLNSIRRGDEVDSFDNKTKNDATEKVEFILSGNVSLRLAAANKRAALMWISGIYHIAIHASNVYAKAWITNSSKIASLFASGEPGGIPDFKSKTISQELEKDDNSLQNLIDSAKQMSVDDKEWPESVDDLVYLLQDLKLIRRTDVIEPIVTAVKELLATRESWIHKLIKRLKDVQCKNVENLVRFAADCACHLKALDVPCEVSRKKIWLFDDYLNVDEAIRLLYNVVKHYSITVDLRHSNEDDPPSTTERNIIKSGKTNKSLDNDVDGADEKGAQKLDANSSSKKNENNTYEELNQSQDLDPLESIPNDQYQKFLENVQRADKFESAEQLIELLTRCTDLPLTVQKPNKQKLGSGLCVRRVNKSRIPIRAFTIMGFHWSLAQKFNAATIPQDAEEILNLLKYPLNSFWIASSHNTYLTGNQVGGAAAAGALADALLRGCRCIELDCQDGPNGEPVLCHSWKNCQLTGSITLSEALIACKETAFKFSKLPVILSMQMHCTDECKMKTAETCRKILGDALYIPDPANPADFVASIPLGSLLSKFIIKGKMRTEGTAKNVAAEKKWLSVVALHGYRLTNMTAEDIGRVKRNNVYSLNESKFAKVAAHQAFLRRLTDISMIRIYPSGTRVASTNFCPLNAWASGIQCVALNYQSCDRSMLINYGKFNQSFGYVLKPPELRPITFSNEECLDYFCRGKIKLKVHVLSASQLPPPNEGLEQTSFANALDNVLYSIQEGGTELDVNKVATQLGKPPAISKPDPSDRDELQEAIERGLKVDKNDAVGSLIKVYEKSSNIVNAKVDNCCPFVEIVLVGKGERILKTEIVNFNGFNPVWADTTPPFEFIVKEPNLAVLLLAVKHHDNVGVQIIGQTALPVNRIRPGIRWAQLLDQRLMEIECCGLLLHIDITYVD
ncbi:Phosphatidylinositol-specific phospholipase C X domain family protein [Babesia bovis T2Bo]|uniref:Phosphoinositide phospholipase C n=1 Tax=Babesia bovis TaxID=5865 RepID=A7ASE0_BABBO|nr:Phosphatidylinositol-specific phospholipase C X domain family protein [Babesia bovis T2Bo]EDO07459.1 Phosphatidylinositol-specific phospholipase C X domain family protein [Babesia bovis T2Bo]|eukprot:XP_001611027.1 phospholipase C gamma 1 [Babesia bovis T2Bo]